MRAIVAAVIAASLIGGVATAQDRSPQGSVEAQLDRIEQALARLKQKLSARAGAGMMEGCRDMMGGGMMACIEPLEELTLPGGRYKFG